MSDFRLLAGKALLAEQGERFADQGLEHQLRELVDREQIRNLTSLYAQRVAQGFPNSDLFTDDGVYINRQSRDAEPTEVRGRAALDAHWGYTPERIGGPTPMIHNHVIVVDGNEASAICSIELRIVHGTTKIFASGYYEDRLRRENGRWKFAVRDVTFFRWGPDQ